jgi:hypothetical protein
MSPNDDDIPDGIDDLRPTSRTATTITLTWTQIDGGDGQPAEYRVKYHAPPMDWRTGWSTGTVGCSRVTGSQIGAPLSCTVTGLEANRAYDFQLMSYRIENGGWARALRSNIATGRTSSSSPTTTVSDLMVTGATAMELTVTWTEVDDGTGRPASYRVKYGTPIGSWRNATIGCAPTIRGRQIGAPIQCTIEDLQPGTTYEVQLMSFRTEDGAWVNARYSNRATGSTEE